MHSPGITRGEPHQALTFPHTGHPFSCLRPLLGEQELLLVGVGRKLHPVLLPAFNCLSITCTKPCWLCRGPLPRNGTGKSGQPQFLIALSSWPVPSSVGYQLQGLRLLLKNQLIIEVKVGPREAVVIFHPHV